MPNEKKSQDPHKYLNLKYANVLGFLFLAVYLSYMVVQNLMSEIQSQNGFGSLGFLLVGIIYMSQMVSSILSVPICAKIGLKKAGFLGGLLLTMVVVFQIPPAMRAARADQPQTGFMGFFLSRGMALFFSIMGSILGGLGQGLIWVMQGEYVSKCATPNSIGFYFGLGFAWYMSSQIFGNFIGSLLVRATSGPYFFLSLALIQIVPVIAFLFIGMPKPIPGIQEEASEQEEEPSFCQKIKDTLKCMVSRKMMFANFEVIYSGVSIAFFSGLLSPIMILQQSGDATDQTTKEAKALMAMVLFGVGEVTGSFLTGFVIDRVGKRMACLFEIFVITLMAGVTLWNLYELKFGYQSYLMCFFWGLQDSAVNLHLFSIFGFEFESQSEPFGVFNAVQGFFLFFVELIQIQIDFNSQKPLIYYTIFTGCCGVVCCFVAFFFPYKPVESTTALAEKAAAKRESNLNLIQEKSSQYTSTAGSPLLSQESRGIE